MSATDRVFGALSSLAIKAPCRVATTANVTLSGLQTIDGVVLVADDRVLVKSQTDSIENGIYVADTSTWERAPDFDGNLDITEGTTIPVNQGSTNAETWWRISTTGSITIGTTSLAFELAVVNSASMVNFLQSGAGAVSETMQTAVRRLGISPYQFGGIGNGVANDSAAVLAASVAAVAAGVPVIFAGGTWSIGTQIALTSSHNALVWELDGATIKKGFNGDLITVTNCAFFKIIGTGTIDGKHGTYTGKGFVITGAASHEFHVGAGIKTMDFTGAHFEYGADAGYLTRLDCLMVGHATQPDPTMIDCTGTDTSAMQRSFRGVVVGQITLTATLATFITCPLVSRVLIDATCSVTVVRSCSWSSGAVPIVIDGANTFILGCRLAQAVTINAGFSGGFVGNHQTVAGFTNNSIAGNATILHDGILYASPGTVSEPSVTFNGDTDTGVWQRTGNVITLTNAGADNHEFRALAYVMGSSTRMVWADTATISAITAIDSGISRSSAGILKVDNGAGTITSLVAKFISSDSSAGINASITTADLVGKTITVKDGIITGYA